jgi:hypothetical protein
MTVQHDKVLEIISKLEAMKKENVERQAMLLFNVDEVKAELGILVADCTADYEDEDTSLEATLASVKALEKSMRAPTELEITALSPTVAEDQHTTRFVTFIVTRHGDVDPSVMLEWSVGGTVAADDFLGGVLPAGTLTLSEGQKEARIEVALKGDRKLEGDEVVAVTLTNPVGATLRNETAMTTVVDAPVHRFASRLTWRSGFRLQTNTPASQRDGQIAIAAWRGRPTDIHSAFMGDTIINSWPTLASNWVHTLLRDSVAMGLNPWTIAVPLLCLPNARQYVEGARGDFDSYHVANARKLALIFGTNMVVIRLGWEANAGYPWSWQDGAVQTANTPETAAAYKACWNRIAAIYRAELPGAVLEFNCLRNITRPLALWAPESADIYSVDAYDSFTGSFYVDNPNGFMGDYNTTTGMVTGPRGIAKFARARGKKWAVAEWGVTNLPLVATDKSNRAPFIVAMKALFDEYEEHLFYECYFQAGTTKQWHHIYANPMPEFNAVASAAYLSVYR